MSDYLMYWRPSTERDFLLNHAGSEQFKRVQRDDRIWFVTIEKGRLLLFGRMCVGDIVSQQQAQKRLRTNDLWPAKYHALAEPGTVEHTYDVDISALPIRCGSRARLKGSRMRTPLRIYKQCVC